MNQNLETPLISILFDEAFHALPTLHLTDAKIGLKILQACGHPCINTSGIPINPPTIESIARMIKGIVIAEGLSCR